MCFLHMLRYAFLGFGGGPRMCIGMRFALLEAKMAMIMILSKYNFVRSPKTSTKIKLDPASLFGAPLDGLWIRVEPRN